MHIMLTVLAALCALLSTAFAYIAYTHANRALTALDLANRAAGKLNAMSGRVIALEGALETLSAQHRKLSGKFHAAKNSETPPSVDVGLAPAELRKPALDRTGNLFREVPFCPNWQQGQISGPLSDAARCECDYCNEQRARRAMTKAELLPAARAATLATSRTRE